MLLRDRKKEKFSGSHYFFKYREFFQSVTFEMVYFDRKFYVLFKYYNGLSCSATIIATESFN